MVEYSFCEPVNAVVGNLWHIRRLTEIGRKFGGGADTLSLCGRTVAWDMNVPFDTDRYRLVLCRKCLAAFKEITDEQVLRSAEAGADAAEPEEA